MRDTEGGGDVAAVVEVVVEAVVGKQLVLRGTVSMKKKRTCKTCTRENEPAVGREKGIIGMLGYHIG